MNVTHFEKGLQALVRRKPFQPFEVELNDGQRLLIDRPDAVGFNGGAAAFIAEDGSIHFFNSRDVRCLGEDVNGASA